jgi:hypothetical protein
LLEAPGAVLAKPASRRQESLGRVDAALPAKGGLREIVLTVTRWLLHEILAALSATHTTLDVILRVTRSFR